MALIVEDGSLVADANSYVSLVDADAYFAAAGQAQWAAPDAIKTQYLVNAAAALDALYGPRFISGLVSETGQTLLFPRSAFYDNNGRSVSSTTIPQALKNAQCEMALLTQQGVDLYPEGRKANNITAESVGIGEISQSFTYKSIPKDQASYDGFRKVELILAPLLTPIAKRMRFRL